MRERERERQTDGQTDRHTDREKYTKTTKERKEIKKEKPATMMIHSMR